MHDPLADPVEAKHEYGISLVAIEKLKPANAVVAAVAHRSYREMTMDTLNRLMDKNPVFIDVKGIFNSETLRKKGVRLWRL